MSLVDASPDPLAHFDIDPLIEGSGRLRPQQTAFRDDTGATVSFGDLDLCTRAMAGGLASLGLFPGECVLVIAVPRIAGLLGIFAALRAGLNVAVAPPHLGVDELAAFAARAKAVAALVGGPYGEIVPLDLAMRAAATCQSLRMLCALEGGDDGAVDLNEFVTADYVISSAAASAAKLVTIVPGGALRHAQRTLIASAIDAATRLRIGAGQAIVSTLPPASFAGLVAGPLLALITGANLHLHGPFQSQGLLDALRTQAPAHLLVPRALGPSLQDAGLLHGADLAALLLLHRATSLDESVLPFEGVTIPVFDLTAYGETCLIVEPRDADGEALPPAGAPHMIELEGRSLLAVRRAPGTGALRLEGDAVTTL